MSGDVLDAIDGALRDYDTSHDAMRWVPDRVICDGGQPLRIGWHQPGSITVLTPTVIAVDDATAAAFTALAQRFQALGRATVDMWEPAAKAIADLAHAIDRGINPGLHNRWCARCRPLANPRPLCIDGAEYRRRQRNRRKRRR